MICISLYFHYRHVYQIRWYKLFNQLWKLTSLQKRKPFLSITLALTMSASMTIWFILALSFLKKAWLWDENYLKSLMSSLQAISNLTFYPLEWMKKVFIAFFSCLSLFIILFMPLKHKHFLSLLYSGFIAYYLPETWTSLNSYSNGW